VAITRIPVVIAGAICIIAGLRLAQGIRAFQQIGICGLKALAIGNDLRERLRGQLGECRAVKVAVIRIGCVRENIASM